LNNLFKRTKQTLGKTLQQELIQLKCFVNVEYILLKRSILNNAQIPDFASVELD